MLQLLRVFMQGGFAMWLLVLIMMVLTGIILRTAWLLSARRGIDSEAIQSCLDGLLFWGGFAVLIGVLGSAIGYHKAMSAVVKFGVVNPGAIFLGSAEGLVSTLAALLVLSFAGAFWFILRGRFNSSRQTPR